MKTIMSMFFLCMLVFAGVRRVCGVATLPAGGFLYPAGTEACLAPYAQAIMMVRASTVRDDAGLGLLPVVSHSGLVGRLACLFAVAVLLCVSSAHGQVIEEGGFPVKGGGRFRGVVFLVLSISPCCRGGGIGSAVVFCDRRYPRRGVRYGWESVSGEGLRLLSDAQDELARRCSRLPCRGRARNTHTD